MSKAKVLVIDDEAMMRKLMIRALSDEFEVLLAENGAEGLAIFNKEKPSVVILDIVMPEMDGIEFLKEIRPKLNDPYDVIVATGINFNEREDVVTQCYELGISSFIHKPMSIIELKGAVKRSIEINKLEQKQRNHQEEIQALNSLLEQRVIERTRELEDEIERRKKAEEVQKELLESTLKGTIQVLVDILALISPAAFNRARRMRDYVSQLTEKLHLTNCWKYELAAMLSQLGCVTVPNKTFQKYLDGANLSKEETNMINSYPDIAKKLLIHIPRLEDIAGMIGHYQYLSCGEGEMAGDVESVTIGGDLIHLVLDFDDLLCRNYTPQEAVDYLREKSQCNYKPELLEQLMSIEIKEIPSRPSAVQEVDIKDLQSGMILQDKIQSKDGTIVADKGHEINRVLMRRLMNFLENNMLDNQSVKAYQPSHTEKISS